MRSLRLLKMVPDLMKRIVRPEMSRINLALTLHCNHKCVSCDIWRNNGTAPKDLSFEEARKLIDKNNLMWLSLTGGEPTMNRDFEGILTYALNKLPMVNVITNGEDVKYIPGYVMRALKNSRKGMLVLHISLFGSPTVHNKMTGIENSYNHQVMTMKALTCINDERLILGFEHMLSHQNIGEFKNVQNVANNLGVGVTYVVEQNAGYYMNETKQLPKLEIPSFNLTSNPVDWFKNTFLFRYQRKGSIKCVASQYSCFVLPNKNVYSCFFRVPDNPAFNLLDSGFKVKQDYFDKDKEFISNCKGCLTPCESYTAIVYKPWRVF